jgi:hypothetical protein
MPGWLGTDIRGIQLPFTSKLSTFIIGNLQYQFCTVKPDSNGQLRASNLAARSYSVQSINNKSTAQSGHCRISILP